MEANPPAIPDSLRQVMAQVGPIWGTNISGHSKLMIDGYSALHVNAPKPGAVTRDIPYGQHNRQVLDVYVPPGAVNAPVVVFAHGGAFVDGCKDRSAEVYANVCWYLARHGIIGLNIEYRLAPEFKYPCATEDFAAAVAWTRASIGKFGGDANRIFAMGHSAGSTHAGCYAYDKRFHPKDGSGIVGFITVSGRVRIEIFPDNPNARKVEAYFGADQALMEQGSPVTHVGPDSVPTLIALAQFENPLLDMHGAELFHRLAAAKRRAPRIVWLPTHNHNSAISHVNTAEDLLGRNIVEFIRNGW